MQLIMHVGVFMSFPVVPFYDYYIVGNFHFGVSESKFISPVLTFPWKQSSGIDFNLQDKKIRGLDYLHT